MKREYKIEEFDAIDGFFALITEVNSRELVAKAYSSQIAKEIVAALLASSQGQGRADEVGHHFCAAMPCGPGDCGPAPCRYLEDAIANRNNHPQPEGLKEAADRLCMVCERYALMSCSGIYDCVARAALG